MSRAIRLGRIGGADIVADLSVFVVAAAVVWVLYVDTGVAYPGTDPAVAAIIALLAGAAFVGSAVAHESSHAIVARRRGMRVLRVRLLSFGGHTMIDGRSERPVDELAISASGSVVSFALFGVFWLAGTIADGVPEIQASIRFLALVNLFIAGFNLLPGFPLDGGYVFRSVVWLINGDRLRATRIAVRAGRVFGWLVVGTAFVVALATLSPWALLGAVVGWYLVRSSEAAGRRELLEVGVEGLVAGDVMRETPDPVPGEMLIDRVIDLYQIGSRLRSVPVEVDGLIRGVLGEAEIGQLTPAGRVTNRASEVMAKIGPGDVIDVSMPLDAMMQRPTGRTGRRVVVRDGRAVGIIEAADLGDAVDRAG